MRAAPALLALVAVSLTGCSSAVGPTTPTPVAQEALGTADRPEGPCAYPGPPANLTRSAAADTALEHEAVRVYNTLVDYNYSEWGVGAWQSPKATVTNQTATGYLVRVEMFYSYQYDGGYADSVVTARYFVNDSAVRRVGGEPVSPLGSAVDGSVDAGCEL